MRSKGSPSAWVPAQFLKRMGKKRFGVVRIFFYFAPPNFKFAHPGYGVLGGQKRIVAHPNH